MDRKAAIAEAIKIAGNEIINNAEDYIANDRITDLRIEIDFIEGPFSIFIPKINVDADYTCNMKG